MSDEVLKELDAVALLEDLPTHGLVAGDVGTVVFVHHEGHGYEVEFMDADGRTLAVETLQATRSRPFEPGRSGTRDRSQRHSRR